MRFSESVLNNILVLFCDVLTGNQFAKTGFSRYNVFGLVLQVVEVLSVEDTDDRIDLSVLHKVLA